MSVSAAIEEAYASGDTSSTIVTSAQIDHASFTEPFMVVAGFDPADIDAVIYLPLTEGGPKIPHHPCGFTFIRGGHDKDGPTDARAIIDNVSGMLSDLLSGAIGYNSPIIITFRQYIVSPAGPGPISGPDEEIAGMQMRRVDLYEDRAEGTLSWPDGRTANVPTGPNAFFDVDNYPALFGS